MLSISRRCLCTVSSTSAFASGVAIEHEAPRDVFLKPSSSRHRKQSIVFCRNVNEMPSYASKSPPLGPASPIFKIVSPTCDYYALRIPLLKAGFKRLPDPSLPLLCNVAWGKSAPANIEAASAQQRISNHFDIRNGFQKFNHFPRSHMHLGCKKGMALSLQSLERTSGQVSHFEFTPKTLFFPENRQEVCEMLGSASEETKFIWKPARGSCGRGIIMCRGGNHPSWKSVMDDIDRQANAEDTPPALRTLLSHYVVQRYIENPFLIAGRKLDLRLYVAVTSYDPLVAYLHRDGLVRFAAQAYEEGDVTHRFGHLTNYSVGRRLEKPQGEDGSPPLLLDLKWTMQQFEAKLDDTYGALHPTLSFGALMAKARRVIATTLLAAKKNIAAATEKNCVGNFGNFVELYGFDIMFDMSGKAWLIEVNTLPSLESSSTMDYHTKSGVVTDLLNMAMIEPFERSSASFDDCGLHAFDAAIPNGSDIRAGNDPALLNSFDDRCEDLKCRLVDEVKYGGGFARIFPDASGDLKSLYAAAGCSELDYAALKFVEAAKVE